MSYALPDGSKVSIASLYDAIVAMSAVSNAEEAIATVPAVNDFAAADIVVVTSGWLDLDQRVARLKAVNAGAITLEEIDTTDLKDFPAGAGAGTMQRVSEWTPIPQVVSFEVSGGDQNYANIEFLDDKKQRQLPTSKSPTTLAISIADDPTKPHNKVLAKADKARLPRIIRLELPNGSNLYYNGIVSFNSSPSLAKGSVMATKASQALSAEFTRYFD
ncbi:phage tail protein [Herbaspirillum sp. NPDC101397]|uniref:phage tail protein n=1 Tax=Herbaspirillum sp. NPDC101397 TaxID=3364006 RepID=UPI00383BA45D